MYKRKWPTEQRERVLLQFFPVGSTWDPPRQNLLAFIHVVPHTINVPQLLYHIWQLHSESARCLMFPRTVNAGLCSLLCRELSDEIF